MGSCIEITIIHVQRDKNNFKQPFYVLWGLSRSLLIRKPIVSIQTTFSETTQPWLIMISCFRGTQRQFSENVCSEDDSRSRIFGTFCKISCLPASPSIFELQDFVPLKRPPRIFGSLFLAEIFEKVSFDPYNFWITRLSARKAEQMKSF